MTIYQFIDSKYRLYDRKCVNSVYRECFFSSVSHCHNILDNLRSFAFFSNRLVLFLHPHPFDISALSILSLE